MEWISSSTVLYILAVNGITFLAFGLDKYKAVHHRFRIREATLFTLALLGGAAGGLGYAFMQYFGARMRSGAELLLDLAGFERLLAGAGLVITGEGHADAQTLMGKLPLRVLQRASVAGIPVWLVAGRADDTQALLGAGFSAVEAITPEGTDTAEALRPDTAKRNIALWVQRNTDRLKSRTS